MYVTIGEIITVQNIIEITGAKQKRHRKREMLKDIYVHTTPQAIGVMQLI